MSRIIFKNSFSFPFLLTAFLLIFPVPLPAWANGNHHGKQTGEMSSHMQSMMNVKENIPPEFRVMDRTPVTPTEKSLETGKELFLQNCAVCHGEKGDGTGPAAAGMKTRPANFLDLEHSSMYGPGEKYWIIENGLPDMGMPAFGSQLSPRERWSLVNHILHLQDQVEAESLFSDQHKHSH